MYWFCIRAPACHPVSAELRQGRVRKHWSPCGQIGGFRGQWRGLHDPSAAVQQPGAANDETTEEWDEVMMGSLNPVKRACHAPKCQMLLTGLSNEQSDSISILKLTFGGLTFC